MVMVVVMVMTALVVAGKGALFISGGIVWRSSSTSPSSTMGKRAGVFLYGLGAVVRGAAFLQL